MVTGDAASWGVRLVRATAAYTGHSLRVTGAQGLTVRGWHLWTIQLLGRWGSEAIKTYVREAPLEAMLRPAAAASLDLDQLIDVLAERLPRAQEPQIAIDQAPLPSARALAREQVVLQESASMELVRNDTSGIVHKKATSTMARCGWRYERRPHTLVAQKPGDAMCCGNCFA